jgi:hypothetical protein
MNNCKKINKNGSTFTHIIPGMVSTNLFFEALKTKETRKISLKVES